MDIRLLGPLEVERQGRRISLGPKQQMLLAILLVNRGATVPADRIADDLFGARVPRNALKTLHVHISRLRKALGDGAVQTGAGGYRLALEARTLDAERFDELADAGRLELAGGNAGSASTLLSDALALWRGPALTDFAYEAFAQSEIARLEERRLTAHEDRFQADLALGRHVELTPELEALVREHPLRERLRGQLMLALYRSRRQAEALDVYQDGRRALVDDLGIEPGRELRELERAILQQDPGLELVTESEPAVPAREAQPTPVPPASHESRKVVTALSTAIPGAPARGVDLDAEALRRVTTVVFTRVSDAVKAHGGKVESVSAEAMSTVFGVPEVHEDDTLRAVRAALDIQESLVSLAGVNVDRGIELGVQIGISTGEVVVGGASDIALPATGAPFIEAERLARAADAGETLLDAATAQRVGRLVEGEPKEVAGRSAFRLSRLRESAAVEPRFSAPMVGRERERRRLEDAYEQAIADRSCHLFTILGSAGVGKSRLVQEFLDRAGQDVLVARGRCLPYGEGITFWPLLEAIKDIVDIDDDAPETTAARIAELLSNTDDAARIGEHMADMIGLSEARLSADERLSATRSFVEELGRRAPFALVFDDIHWGEETFLDLVEHLADWCRESSVFLVCMARPELLDIRPTWGGGKLNATAVRLEPLSDDDCEALVGHLLGDPGVPQEVRTRIADAAEGNPLFVEEMVAMLVDDGLLVRDRSGWVATHDLARFPVPPTISGLLSARLDRLPPSERAVLERASVEGKVFHRSSIEALSDPETGPSIGEVLARLLRKELIRPDRPVFPGEDAYRFRHLLIRDTAYDSIPKQLRAELHERHARWLQDRIGRLAVEYDEIVGYHLEQTYRYRNEIGEVDDPTRAVGRRAAELLGSSGRRAFLRSDAPAGANLLARAVALLPPEDPFRVELIPNVRVVQGLGDLSWADRVLTEAVEASATTGNRELAAHALVQRGLLRLFSDPTVTARELLDVSERARGVFEELHDELGLSRAWRLAAQAHYLDRRAGACAEASERALVHARRSDRFEEREVIEWLVIALILGPEPAPSALGRCEELLGEVEEDSLRAAEILAVIAPLLAMQGRGEEAEAAFDRATAIMTDRGEWIWIAVFWHSFLHVWHGTAQMVEPELRTAYESLKAIGEKSHFSSLSHALANVVLAQGRDDEAEILIGECEAASRHNDVHSQIASRTIRARILARRGLEESALHLGREAIDFGAESDFLLARAEAHEGLAEVLELAGRPAEAADELERAVALYEEKGNGLATKAVHARLAALSV